MAKSKVGGDVTATAGVSEADMRKYQELAKHWETDQVTNAKASERRAWWAVSGLAVVAVVQGLAIFGLTPLKQSVPFVVQVEKSTGVVDTVSRLTATSNTATEAVNKYMLGKYVRAREEFSEALAPVNYKTVALMSSPAAANVYAEWFRPENPQSPLKVYGSLATVTVRIRNVSFLAENIASVRYEKTIRTTDGQVTRSNWQATITFRYSNAPMTEDDRLVNPIGFEVSDYRNDPEVGG
ncbi:hypothetical protein TB15x_20665 [Xanthomonas perforans]|uniref:virB8 family protein n=3 Tax=Xanthomonas TaxID=338 RepID=UPI00062CFA00|nr:VirB8/TrbF family protein [Xanthomonas perforans]KLD35833.1 hypothetical protein TB15x_20665 [Xanthomonas perforans]MBZ2436243.1 virB8 family protein [Xanthomonas perforans]MBZ2461355.1 virB8 family protein [Xanthomonas perforans]MBZ2482781.1 virB8 family protein [Xanthomonas perforans]MBZ2491349.1 virB8 family protein [Xanthomonas perforans]